MKTGCIYIIRNKVNDKVYIGQTTSDIRTRFIQHKKNSTLRTRHYKLYNAIKKYGKDQFYIETLENNISIDELNRKEIEYIEKFNSMENGYNVTKGGDGRIINKLYDEETIVRLYKEGKSCTEIGKLFNVCNTTIWRVLVRKGVPTRHDGNKYEGNKERFIELWNKGVLRKDIVKELNINERTIGRYVKRFGVKPRHNRLKQ